MTPWGRPDHKETLAPGIVRMDTPSHGGYRVTGEALAVIQGRFPTHQPFAGEGWYEEDQDWAIVALTFPDLFPAECQEQARQTVQYSAQPFQGRRDRGWEGVALALGIDTTINKES